MVDEPAAACWEGGTVRVLPYMVAAHRARRAGETGEKALGVGIDGAVDEKARFLSPQSERCPLEKIVGRGRQIRMPGHQRRLLFGGLLGAARQPAPAAEDGDGGELGLLRATEAADAPAREPGPVDGARQAPQPRAGVAADDALRLAARKQRVDQANLEAACILGEALGRALAPRPSP